MKLVHILLAVLVAAIWGFAFVATKVGLAAFTPPQLLTLRFLIAAVPAAFVARPNLPWSTLLATGMVLFTGQFLLQFFGIQAGMPAGLAAIVVQSQAFFTVLLAVVILRERARPRQVSGMVLAAFGMGLIMLTVGSDLRPLGLALTLASALSWAMGNILLKRIGGVDMLPLVVWLSLIPPAPALMLALALDGPAEFWFALKTATWVEYSAVFYLGAIATTLAYAIWGYLLKSFTTAQVVPFALLAPFFGSISSALLLGEEFGPLRLGGMGFVLFGLAVIVLRAGGRA